jgi:antitoxin VapB
VAHTAKLFLNGRSQAVRLPADCRFEGDRVFIRRDSNGDVILSSRPASWDAFFRLRDETEIPDDFLSDRVDEPAQERDLF